MSGQVVGQATRTARKAHGCYLCSLPINPGSRYLAWAWVEDGRAQTMRSHLGCDAYAQSNLFEWTSGDGIEEGAVEAALEETLFRQPWNSPGQVSVDLALRAQVLASFPGLAPLVAKVCATEEAP
jgi:hypothetical protein